MAQESTSGGRIAQEIATEDELKQAVEGEDAGNTRVTKSHKQQPTIPTRADHKNQNG